MDNKQPLLLKDVLPLFCLIIVSLHLWWTWDIAQQVNHLTILVNNSTDAINGKEIEKIKIDIKNIWEELKMEMQLDRMKGLMEKEKQGTLTDRDRAEFTKLLNGEQ